MAEGEFQIDLQPNGIRAWLRRRLGRTPELPAPPAANVDTTLLSRIASEQVKAFVEAIDTYQLQSRTVIRVRSNYRMPRQAGIREQVPVWLAERIRFGVVEGDSLDFRYAAIRRVHLRWDDDSTDLLLYLDERVEAGTRAFIAAYLGEGMHTQALRDLPLSSNLGSRDG